MAWEQERAYIAEDQAKLVQYSDNNLLYKKQLVRNWPSERDALIESTLEYLYSYSTDNNTDPPTAQQYVDTPKANRLEYDDIWRVVSNEKTSTDTEAQWPGVTGIIQTLRYGYAEALSWDEARVINNELSPGNASTMAGVDDTTSDDPEDFLFIEWVNLDPHYTSAMARGTDASGILAGDTVSSPVIRGVPYPGILWHKVYVQVLESELNDGSGRIRVMLARPQYTLNAYTTFDTGNQVDVSYLWNVPKDLAQTILDDFQDQGHSARCTYNKERHLVDMVLHSKDFSEETLINDVSHQNCDAQTLTSYYWGVESPSTYNIPALGNGKTGRKRIVNRGDGSFDIIISVTTRIYRNYDAFINYNADVAETTEQQQYGVLADNNIVDITVAETGKIKRQTRRVQEDCSKDVVTTIRESNELDSGRVTYDTKGGTAATQVLRNHVGIPTTEITALSSANSNSVGLGINDDGTYNATLNERPSGGASESWSGTSEVFFEYAPLRPRGQVAVVDTIRYAYMLYRCATEAAAIDWVQDFNDGNAPVAAQAACIPPSATIHLIASLTFIKRVGDNKYLVQAGWDIENAVLHP